MTDMDWASLDLADKFTAYGGLVNALPWEDGEDAITTFKGVPAPEGGEHDLMFVNKMQGFVERVEVSRAARMEAHYSIGLLIKDQISLRCAELAADISYALTQGKIGSDPDRMAGMEQLGRKWYRDAGLADFVVVWAQRPTLYRTGEEAFEIHAKASLKMVARDD